MEGVCYVLGRIATALEKSNKIAREILEKHEEILQIQKRAEQRWIAKELGDQLFSDLVRDEIKRRGGK